MPGWCSFAKDTPCCLGYLIAPGDSLAGAPQNGGQAPMTKAISLPVVIVTLVLAASPVHAGPCAHSIDRVQAQVDAVIDARAGSGPWRPESLNALRNYQPTPRSIARADAASGNGSGLQIALNALERARDADLSADVTGCNAQLNKARRALGLRRH